MQSIKVNGYEMAWLEIGKGPPLVLVHGTLGDFRTWNSVMGPLSRSNRVISVSLRRFFPEHWNGIGDDYKMAQHVSDVIAFIERIAPRPVDLMGHSRGGHIGFRVAEQRPDLLRKLVLAEPGGDLDASLIEPGEAPPPPMTFAAILPMVLKSIRNGDIDAALKAFV
jgi:pimeloyl-ACP methyl ester carboxylesterase